MLQDRPSFLGPYRLLELVGRGGMGSVFRAVDPAGRSVAVKVPSPEADPRRALAEARAAARLRHPAIVPIHGVGEEAGRPFLVLEWLPGGSLEERLERGGPLPLEEVRDLGVTLARGLAHAHAHGVLHRDVKPANVLFTEDGRPRLGDFGLALDVDTRTRLTRTGALLGSPQYWSPEQAVGARDRVDARADVYGLGGTLFAALTGRPPFLADTLVELLAQTVSAPPPAPSSLRPEVVAALDAVVLRCLAKEPAERFQSAAELADALAAVALRGPGRAGRRRAGAALLVVATLSGGAALALARRGAPSGPARPAAATASWAERATSAATAGDALGWGEALEAARREGVRLDPRSVGVQRQALAERLGAALDAEGPLAAEVVAGARALLATWPADDAAGRAGLELRLVRGLRWRGRSAEALEAAPTGVAPGAAGPALALERELLLAGTPDEAALERHRREQVQAGPGWLRERAAIALDLGGRGVDRAVVRARAEKLALQRPGDPYVLLLLVGARASARDAEGAFAALELARAAAPRDPEVHLAEARLRRAQGDVPGYLAALDRHAAATEDRALEPGVAAVSLRLFELFDGAAAEAHLDRLLRAHPGAQVLHVLRGVARRLQGDLEGAEASWRLAELAGPRELDASVAGLPYGLGPRVLRSLGRDVAEPGIVAPVPVVAPEARRLAVLRLLARAGGGAVEAAAGRALEAAYLGAAAGRSWPTVAAALEAASAAAPQDPVVALRVAELLVLRDHDGPALDALERARQLASRRDAAETPPAWRACLARLEAEVHLRHGRRGEALARFEAAAAAWRDEVDGRVAAAQARAVRGDAEGAVQRARSALELDPTDHAAQVALASAEAIVDPRAALVRAHDLWATTGYLDARVSCVRWEAAVEHTVSGGLFAGAEGSMQDVDLALTWCEDARLASAGVGPDIALLTYGSAFPGAPAVVRRALARVEAVDPRRADLLVVRATTQIAREPAEGPLRLIQAALERDPWVPVRRHVELLLLARAGPEAVGALRRAVEEARAAASRAIEPGALPRDGGAR